MSVYSPCKMMNEWSLPTSLLEEAVCQIVEKLKGEGSYIPAITITGGFSSEDHLRIWGSMGILLMNYIMILRI